MQTIVIVIHLIVVIALVGVVLLQRSEGGGLGIGGGGSGMMAARSSSNALTKVTALLAVAFFATSLSLSVMARYAERPTDILDRMPGAVGGQQTPGSGGVLDQLGGSDQAAPPAEPAAPAEPQVPSGQ